MDKEWLKFDRRGKKYQEGARNFANAARARSGDSDMIVCPCSRCINLQYHHFDIVYEHIVIKGFDPKYKTWFLHGERPSGSIQYDDVEIRHGTHKDSEFQNDEIEGESRVARDPDIKSLVREAESPLLSDCIKNTNGAHVNKVVGDKELKQGSRRILDEPIDYKNAKCHLSHWYNFKAHEVVAEGHIDSVDPHSKVHDMPLGKDCWKVSVNHVFNKDLMLYRSTNNFNKLGETLGSTVAWPKSYIKLM